MSTNIPAKLILAVLCVFSCSVVGSAWLYAQGFPGQAEEAIEQKVENAQEVIRNSDDAASCAAECTQCANTCLAMIQYCDKIGDKYDGLKAACEDCLAVCRLTADTEKRSSPIHEMMMPVCVEACRLMIEQCSSFPEDDYCKECIRDGKACIGAVQLHMKGASSK